MKKISISFALARFVFFSGFALAVFSTILVINHMVDTVNKQQAQLIKRQTTTINNSYNLFLQHRLTLLREQANFPIIVQTVMQPDTNLGRLKDFMADITLLGERYQQTLLDFEGNPLYSNINSVIPKYKTKPWLKKLFLQEEGDYLGIEEFNGQSFWCIAVAIRYNNVIEGLLVTLIPIEAIKEDSQITEHANGLMIDIRNKGKLITRFGEDVSGQSYIITWPKMSVTFEFTFDNTVMNQELYNAALKFSSLIIIALIFISLLAYRYGYRYFVQPLLLLSDVTGELDKGSDYTKLQENLKIRELDELFIKFNQMAQKVHHREYALKKSYDELSKANEELILSESQLIQSEKMASIGILAAGVAHEINNPIGYIKSNLDILQDYLNSINAYCQEIEEQFTSQVQKDLQQIIAKKHDLQYILDDSKPLLENSIDGVKKVAEIVRNLKTFARAEEEVKTLTDINEGLTATINMVSNELKYNCQLHIDLSPLPNIFAFPGKLNQVFMNLLINAGQSIVDKGDIFIRTYEENNYLVVEIKDTGTGISPDILPQIFTPFFTSKPVGQGTGLGLSISHSIVEQHDGKILISSKVGKGSCFSVYIPFTAQA
ncbi:MAG: two-component sensor histidine kinase [Gammaproteobacteria bacterium]|nr:MAG: two-component sensor histidine kinase [Gammaproteobacteria bacterium]PHR85008.1 MAG: two-component sensor histidine kinase [Colwellia sp.]